MGAIPLVQQSTIPKGGTTFTFIPIVPQLGLRPQIDFRALISSIGDSFSPQWSEHMDMGRADPKFMYNQFSRTISIDFMTAAVHKGEHKIWMQTVNALAAMTYPLYKPGQGFNGIYTKMIIGQLYNVIGLISSFNYTIDNETPWIDDIPLYLNCSLDFRVIGEHKPNYKKPMDKGPLYDGKYHKGIKDAKI